MNFGFLWGQFCRYSNAYRRCLTKTRYDSIVMSLLIPVLRENYASIVGALDKFAPFDWAAQRSIHLFVLEKQGMHSNQLIEYCQNNDIKHVLVPKRLQCARELRAAGYRVHLGPAIMELVQGHALRDFLREPRLDWLSRCLAKLANYGLVTWVNQRLPPGFPNSRSLEITGLWVSTSCNSWR